MYTRGPTLIRRAYRPVCLGAPSEYAKRFHSWERVGLVRKHIKQQHLANFSWPVKCPHPLCEESPEDPMATGVSLKDPTAMVRHFQDHCCLRRPPPQFLDKFGAFPKTIDQTPYLERRCNFSTKAEEIKWSLKPPLSASCNDMKDSSSESVPQLVILPALQYDPADDVAGNMSDAINTSLDASAETLCRGDCTFQ